MSTTNSSVVATGLNNIYQQFWANNFLFLSWKKGKIAIFSGYGIGVSLGVQDANPDEYFMLRPLGRLIGFIPMGFSGHWSSLEHCALCPGIESSMISIILISVQESKGVKKKSESCGLSQGKSYPKSFLNQKIPMLYLQSPYFQNEKFIISVKYWVSNGSRFKTWYYQKNRKWGESLYIWGFSPLSFFSGRKNFLEIKCSDLIEA